MTNAKRLEALKRLKEEMRQPSFRTSIQQRRDCLSQIVPLLNFGDFFYANAMPIADILGRPGFTSNMYEQSFARMDYLIGQAITELEHDITPQESVEFQAKDEKAPSSFEQTPTAELVEIIKQQAESWQKPEGPIWNELMVRFRWISCPKEDSTLIASLDSLLRPLNRGNTMLPPRAPQIPGAGIPPPPPYYQNKVSLSQAINRSPVQTAKATHPQNAEAIAVSKLSDEISKKDSRQHDSKISPPKHHWSLTPLFWVTVAIAILTLLLVWHDLRK